MDLNYIQDKSALSPADVSHSATLTILLFNNTSCRGP